MLSEILNLADEKLSEDARLIKNYFIRLIRHMPNNVYWVDINGITLGCNDNVLKFVGVEHPEDVVGKSYEEIAKTAGWTEEQARSFKEDDQEVIRTGKPKINVEEPVFYDKNRKPIYYLSSRIPLTDESNRIIGIVGTSIDISSEKEADQLRIQNEKLEFENHAHKIIAEEQAKFKKTVNQMVHDIGTPLASLNMLISFCDQVPEEVRVDIRECLMRISGITKSVLDQYTESDHAIEKNIDEKAEPLLLTCTLLQSISEKKHQYHHQNVKFIYDFPEDSNFAFIQMQPNAFKRSISNIINNAVDAFDNKAGVVTLKLSVDEKFVNIIIEDNGKGMPEAVKNKIMDNIGVTSGKAEGHGIGMGQVWDTLTKNNGKMQINSELGKGTRIILTFEKINPPEWLADKINLSVEDTLLILDDDGAIHRAWDKRFSVDAPNIPKKHFTHGQAVIDYVSSLSSEQKDKLFLLTDYELLRQELNGLHVIERTGLKRSILVTSHYENEKVRELAAKMNTKILPKSLASEIPVILKENVHTEEEKAVNIVVIDDDAMYLKLLTYQFLAKDYQVESFYNPYHFLSRLAEFPKTTKIYFDHDFNLPSFNGFDLAKELYEKGYTKLYMLTGMRFNQSQIPPYLILIPKDKANDMLHTI